MVLDSLTSFVSSNGILILGLFIIFLFIAKKTISTLMNMVLIVGISIVFPFFLNWLGFFQISTSIGTLTLFAVTGATLYMIYEISRILYRIISTMEKTGKIFFSPFKNKEKNLGDKVKEIMKKEKEKEKN